MNSKTEKLNKINKIKPRQNLKYQSITNSSKNSSKSTLSNHSKYKQDEQLNDFEFNNAKRAVGKIKKNSPNKKFKLYQEYIMIEIVSSELKNILGQGFEVDDSFIEQHWSDVEKIISGDTQTAQTGVDNIVNAYKDGAGKAKLIRDNLIAGNAEAFEWTITLNDGVAFSNFTARRQAAR